MESWRASPVFSSTQVVGLFMSGEIFRVAESFRVSDRPNMPVRFRMVSDRFLYYFGTFPYGVEQGLVMLDCHTLAGLTSTKDMLDAVGGQHSESSFTTVPEVYALLLAHAEGKSSVLSAVHGNIFFLQGRHGRNWILNLSWTSDQGWIVAFCEELIPHEWLKGTKVFSRHRLRQVV